MARVKGNRLVVIICSIIVLSIVIPQTTSAQLNDEWKKTYGGSADDIARSVLFTDDGGLIVAGYTRSFGEGKLNNVYILKTNKNGYTQWRRTFGGISTMRVKRSSRPRTVVI